MNLPNLRTNQRNIVRLIAQHEVRYPGTTCYLGHYTCSRQNVFLKAVNSLEAKGIIHVDRTNPQFQSWKVKLLVPIDTVLTKESSQP
jgi:hypothetical protein